MSDLLGKSIKTGFARRITSNVLNFLLLALNNTQGTQRSSSPAAMVTACKQDLKPQDLTFSSNSLPFSLAQRPITQLSFSLNTRATDFWRALSIIKAASQHYSVDSLAIYLSQTLSESLCTKVLDFQTTHLDLQPITNSYVAKHQYYISNEFSSYFHFYILALCRREKTQSRPPKWKKINTQSVSEHQ